MVQIAIFNNKGGVGKTTYLYHIANILADIGICTLMVDCDSQCNLTAYAIDDTEIKKSWSDRGNSIYRVIQPASIRVQIAIYRYIKFAAKKSKAQVVLIDLGPNLGALNRTVLGGCDYFITPLSPDLFSIKGTQNLGNKFVWWHDEWQNNLRKWKRAGSGIEAEDLPHGTPKFLGYVTQQHNIRDTKSGMTKGWSIFGKQIDSAVRKNIVQQLSPLDQSVIKEEYMLGKIPNLHSLIPYSLNAHKPVYKCNGSDGLTGEHISKAKNSKALYNDIIDTIMELL